jgi:O-glycosyl hydrolase
MTITVFDKRRLMPLTVIACLLALWPTFGGAQEELAAVAEFTIDVGARRQTIHGFGASDCWYAEEVGAQWAEDTREAIARLLFGAGADAAGRAEGIALSSWRFNLGAGSAGQGEASGIGDARRRVEGFLNNDGSYDWTRQAGQRWFLRAARERGVAELVAVSNSPPVQYTRNGIARKTEQSRASNLDPAQNANFARFLADVIEHFREREGIEISLVSPVNEPQWDWADAKQEGTPWTNGEVAALVRALDAELVRRELSTRILIPECAQYDYAYGRDEHAAGGQVRWFFDPASAGYVGDLARVARVFAGHSYWTDATARDLIDNRRRMREAIAALGGGIELRQTEYSLLGNGYRGGTAHNPPSTMDCALFLARVIHADLTIAEAAGWDFWTALSPNRRPNVNTRYELIALDFEGRTMTPTKLLWALGHWSRFVRPGWRRVEVGAADPARAPEALGSLLVSAYVSAEGDEVAVVAVNAATTTQEIALEVEGADAGGPWTAWLTMDGEENSLRRLVTSEAPTISLPPRSIMTMTNTIVLSVAPIGKADAKAGVGDPGLQ